MDTDDDNGNNYDRCPEQQRREDNDGDLLTPDLFLQSQMEESRPGNVQNSRNGTTSTSRHSGREGVEDQWTHGSNDGTRDDDNDCRRNVRRRIDMEVRQLEGRSGECVENMNGNCNEGNNQEVPETRWMNSFGGGESTTRTSGEYTTIRLYGRTHRQWS